MDFYFDENYSKFMTAGMNEVERAEGRNRVLHVKVEMVAAGFKDESLVDEVVIPFLASRGGILMTKDKKITTRKAQFQLLNESGVSAFFLPQLEVPHWQQMLFVMNRWQKITSLAKHHRIDKESNFFTVPAQGAIQVWGTEYKANLLPKQVAK